MAYKFGDHDFYGMIDLDNFKYLPTNLKHKYNGLGVAGLWIGVCAGFIFQSIAYGLLLKCSNWQKVVDKAVKRNNENKQLLADTLELSRLDETEEISPVEISNRAEKSGLG